jgi:hypothetical protein
MPLSTIVRLLRKVAIRTYTAYRQHRPLKGWWAARRRLERLAS